MAARIYGVSEDKIKADIDRLKLIDEYLDDFLKKRGRYHLVKQLNEHFIDLQEILNWASRPRGVRLNWKPDKSDINELKLVAFYYIRIKFPHLRIRGLRDLFATDDSWQQVKQALTLEVKLSPEERSELGLESAPREEIEEEEDREDTVDPSTFSTVAEGVDAREEAYWKGKHEETLKSFYQDAKEQEQIVKDTERPLALAKRALRNIEAIPADRGKLLEPGIDDVLRSIIARTNDLRKMIQKPTSQQHVLRRRESPARKGIMQRKRSRKGKT